MTSAASSADPPLAAAPLPVAPTAPRFDRLDALRGAAMVWMAAYHFAYDLNYFGLVRLHMAADPLWIAQRTCIVGLFLFCAGAGQAIALRRTPGAGLAGRFDARFWRRWVQVAGCVLAVSAVSYVMFPRTFITFGVLHGIAAMLIVVRLTAGAGRALWALGLVAVLLPRLVSSSFFDPRWTNWVGLAVHRPPTVDYVPLLPWIGAMWWGLAAGMWALRHGRSLLTDPLPAPLAPLAVLGRWPLTFYMLHQPVLMGGLQLWMRLRG